MIGVSPGSCSCLLTAALAGCSGSSPWSIKDAVVVLDCEDGSKTPLLDVPAENRPAAVAEALTAMDDLWSHSATAVLRCSGLPEQRITIRVQSPSPGDLVLFDPPRSIPPGSAGYECSQVAGGSTIVTVRGLSMDGTPIVIEDEALTIGINKPGNLTVVDGYRKFTLTGTWQSLELFYGIFQEPPGATADGGARLALYGNAIFARQAVANGMGSGESLDCKMFDFVDTGAGDAGPP